MTFPEIISGPAPSGYRKRPPLTPAQRRAARAALLAERLAAGDLCAIDDCPQPRDHYDWCSSHFYRWRKYGDPRGQPRAPRNRARGERHGRAKLTDAKVTQIRERRAGGESCASLAAEFGVTSQAISKIVRRRSWNHVGENARIP